jgi:hypothetical protein
MAPILKKISDEWAGLVSLAGAFAAGILFLAFVGGWSSLPEDVSEQAERVERIEQAIVRMDLLICMHLADHDETPEEACLN